MNIYDDIIAQLLRDCPEFQQSWDKHVSWMNSIGKPPTVGVPITVALFLNESYISRQTHFFPRFFGSLERVLTERKDTRTTVDEILESIWKCRVTRINGPELYAAWMGSETKRHWHEIGEKLIARDPKYAEAPLRKQPGPLPEYRVTLKKCEPGEMAVPPDYYKTTGPGTATKFGGAPDWRQPDRRPACPCCNQGMTFVAQIDSIENKKFDPEIHRDRAAWKRDRQWMFGDVGMIYVFFCFDCLETNAVFQCH